MAKTQFLHKVKKVISLMGYGFYEKQAKKAKIPKMQGLLASMQEILA